MPLQLWLFLIHVFTLGAHELGDDASELCVSQRTEHGDVNQKPHPARSGFLQWNFNGWDHNELKWLKVKYELNGLSFYYTTSNCFDLKSLNDLLLLLFCKATYALGTECHMKCTAAYLKSYLINYSKALDGKNVQ